MAKAPTKPRKPPKPKEVSALRHDEARRRNIPTAEMQPLMRDRDLAVQTLRYPRNPDLDPQLVWRGKDQQDWSDLVVQAPPLYIQEKVHPKAIIDDLLAESRRRKADANPPDMPDLFADFNGLSDPEARCEFYAHDQHWSNRMILGDSLQVMASLAEREGLRGKVQCIYFDPPYGIKFNSNFQWSTTSRDVKDGKREHISREPEQVKAFRDTWRDGIHSYLTYLRDRLTVARDLLTESGSIFVQIGDENVHRVRAVMDEVFGEENAIALIAFVKTSGSTREFMGGSFDYLVLYARDRTRMKFRPIYRSKELGGEGASGYSYMQINGEIRPLTAAELANPQQIAGQVLTRDNLTSQSVGRDKGEGAASWFPVLWNGSEFKPSEKGRWKTNESGMGRLLKAKRVTAAGKTLRYVRYLSDFPAFPISDLWPDTSVAGYASDKRYVVETSPKVIERCLLMASDPGDLVLDPTCGSGTTAFVAEQWGRRWITIDTSRVALALARARIMGARYPYYLLADSAEGQRKEGEITGKPPSTQATRGRLRQGFVYERVPHVTLKSIANNAEIDVIWEKSQATLEPLRAKLNEALKQGWEEWQVPRAASEGWSAEAKQLHAAWWEARIARQREIDASIARQAETEYLYDRPYEDRSRVRVAGPFTVESLSPHRILPFDQDGELIDPADPEARRHRAAPQSEEAADFAAVILEQLRRAGIQQANKADRIAFTTLVPWPGEYLCAEGRYLEGTAERRAAIFVGPEFGTVSRPDLAAAAREAAEARFDVLIACAFNFDAHSAEFTRMGRLPVLQARMNADLHMADELKATGAGNLFVVFGEPDIAIEDAGADMIRVRIAGVDVFDPQKGEVRSGGPDSIAVWFIDSDYNEESFFVRQAYFLGANDPYKALKTTLKAEIDEAAWSSLNSDTSRPFPKPKSGRIAVKVINHLGDEVMKVFGVEQ